MNAQVALFFWLIVGHAVSDFALQTDWIAKNKRTSVIVRWAHSLVHGGATGLLLGATYGIMETSLHFIIDSWTINGKRPSLALDQALHVCCKLAYVVANAAATHA